MGLSQIILKVGQPKIITAQIIEQKIVMFFFVICLIHINVLEKNRTGCWQVMEKAHMAFDILNEIKMITIFYSLRWKCMFDFFVFIYNI